ncbi:DUF262 domain-containing protein [Oscillospiraceae bacterium 38-13]
MLDPRKEYLETTIRKIKKNEILLPDFQRQFVWKEEEIQKKLVASVLTRLPIGSILLLKSNSAHEYSCKPIGAKEPISQEHLPTGSVEFLLDGQQRMTVLANVFSNVIFQLTPQTSNLIAPNALKRRFYLALPKYGNSAYPDLFGLHSLMFPMESPETGEPNFLTQDILPFIKVIPFTVKTDAGKCYNPYTTNVPKALSELESYCLNVEEGWMYIPLYLLVADEFVRVSQATLDGIIDAISKTVLTIKKNMLGELLNDGKLDEVRRFITDNINPDIYYDIDYSEDTPEKISEKFSKILESQRSTWASNMYTYLKSCITQINLSQIVLEESQRARAIDIYENLNRGGVSLDIFDLVMARVARVTSEPFYRRLERNVATGCGEKYSAGYISQPYVKKAYQNYVGRQKYHASENMECFHSERNEFLRAYLESFLNVLALMCHQQSGEADEFNVEHLKRQYKLQLTPEQIDSNCENCCRAIDRACFFFQARCGVRTLKEINYTLMVPIVAFVLGEDSFYNGSIGIQIFDLLEAWYWASIFGGAYDKDQNQVMINDLNRLLVNAQEILMGNTPSTDWIKERREHVLKVRGFSDFDFLIMSNADNGEFPKTVIGNTICQFYLSLGYEDFLPNEDGHAVWLTAFSEYASSLQIHHAIPLGSATNILESAKKLRKNKKHYLNSPLNYMYITDRANQVVSSKSLSEYIQLLPKGAGLSRLGFSDTITATATDAMRKDILQHRYAAIQTALISHIDHLLEL